VQDPEIQLKELGIQIPDLLDPKKPAVLDAAHRSFVNYETFYFADDADKRRFDADPTAACGILTDPVTKQRFRPAGNSPRSEFRGRTYFFFTEENKAAFEKAPEAIALPNYDMIGM
jgi:YHS domain-containing protein